MYRPPMSRRVVDGVQSGMALAERGLTAYHTAKVLYTAGSAIASAAALYFGAAIAVLRNAIEMKNI